MMNIPTEPYRRSQDEPDETDIREYAERRAEENRRKRPVMQQGVNPLIDGDGYDLIHEQPELRTVEEVAANVAICASCEYLVGDICVKFSKVCGCTGRHHTRIKSITCPEGKWL
jgi:hypothetical protein